VGYLWDLQLAKVIREPVHDQFCVEIVVVILFAHSTPVGKANVMAQHFSAVLHSQKGLAVACDPHPERLRGVA
jgi:hypothetical protein